MHSCARSRLRSQILDEVLFIYIKPFSNTVQFSQLPTQFRHCHQTKWFVNDCEYFECYVVWWVFDHQMWMCTLLKECMGCQQLKNANMSWLDSHWAVSIFFIKILVVSKASNNCSIKSINQFAMYLWLNFNYADYTSRIRTIITVSKIQCIFYHIKYM